MLCLNGEGRNGWTPPGMAARRQRTSGAAGSKNSSCFAFAQTRVLSWASFPSSKWVENWKNTLKPFAHNWEDSLMRKVLVATTSMFGLLVMQGLLPVRADEALDKLASDPKQWVMQQGNDANTRYSKLNQITAANVKKLQVAWTFSTGVLRGHEGGPLVVGDVMYVHTPFPNTV